MLALDQRESLRRMMPTTDGSPADDATLRRFKSDAMRILSPHASAILLDRFYAVVDRRPVELDDNCALILAADVLHQPDGLPVIDTSLDPHVTPDLLHGVGAAATKLLVIWRRGDDERRRRELVESFVQLAKDAGLASLVEGIVRPPHDDRWSNVEDRHRAVLDAGEELASYGGSIYKAEVPGYVPGDLSRVREHAEQLSERIHQPWVLLSNGTAPQDFPEAVRLARLGGASGFLAGRAIWADTVEDSDPARALATRSIDRLKRLSALVADPINA